MKLYISNIKKILLDNKIDINKITDEYMLDFEPALQNSIKKTFQGCKISGCYFHYVKNLWEKAKRFGLCTKREMKITNILIFLFKLMPYINYDDRIELFNKIENFYTDNEKFKKIIKYYKKTWINNNYLNYEEITQKEYLNRTSNLLEYFHHLLNQQVEVFHPKMSYLIGKYKLFIINIYNNIKESLIKDSSNENHKFSIIKDIFKYIKNYNEKYSSKIDIHLIIQ